MAKNNTKARAKKQVTPPTPPVPDTNKTDNPTPPASDEGNQDDQTTLTPPAPPIDNPAPPTPPTPPVDKFTAKCREVAARYAESYPSCDAFHFCTDMQVFLANDLTEARSHQTEIGKGKVITIKIR